MTIRIAFFAPLLATGGTQRHLQQILALLDRRRFEPVVVTLKPGGEIEGELRAAGVPVMCLGMGTRLGAPSSVRGVLRGARALRRARVDVVHGYQWRPALIGTVVGRLAGARLMLASKRSLTGDDSRARHAWRRIARRVDTVIVNADVLRNEGEAQGMRARWMLLQNGVEVDHFDVGPPDPAARAALGLDRERPVVATVGRLEGRKGQDVLVAATRPLLATAGERPPQILIVGDGPLRNALAAQARELGVAASVHFAGTLADVRPALAATDVFVLPSREEGMSNALMEAMAAARPVVATAVGGNPEVLAGGRLGRLVPPDDAPALADAIRDLLADPAAAGGLGAAARAHATAHWSAAAQVSRLEALYAERLAARGGRRRAA
ncbi:MAG: glycosyltransferase [bacterium]|nr:glycosyltransferase [bacterium]